MKFLRAYSAWTAKQAGRLKKNISRHSWSSEEVLVWTIDYSAEKIKKLYVRLDESPLSGILLREPDDNTWSNWVMNQPK